MSTSTSLNALSLQSLHLAPEQDRALHSAAAALDVAASIC